MTMVTIMLWSSLETVYPHKHAHRKLSTVHRASLSLEKHFRAKIIHAHCYSVRMEYFRKE